MVHLAVVIGRINPVIRFRVIQVDQFPEQAEKAGVKSTPTLVVDPLPPHAGNLPSHHLVFYLWQAANGEP